MIKLSFLVGQDKLVKQKLEQKINQVVADILKSYGNNVESIVLFGSVARNELKYENDILISDIDLMVITKYPLFLFKNKLLKFESVDCEFFWALKLKSVPKNTYWFDIKETGKTIYGREMLNKVPSFEKISLEKSALYSIIYNRMIHLVSAFDPAREQTELKSDLKIVRESCKAILCITDIISIFFEKYSPYLNTRMAAAKEYISFFEKDKNNLLADLDLAANYSLYKKENYLDLWFKAKEYLIFANTFCERKELPQQKWCWNNYIRFYYCLLKSKVIPKLTKNPHLYWRKALLHLLQSVEKQGICESELKESIKCLSKISRAKILYDSVNSGWVKTKTEIEKLLTFLPEF